jgi:hypothetical protein
VEFAFQTIGTWEIATLGRFGLPHGFDRISGFGGPDAPRAPLVGVVTARDDGERFDVTVADADGLVCVRLEGYRSVELPGGLSEDELAIFRAAASSEQPAS